MVTDVRLGDVLYARFGPFKGSQILDRLGNLTPAMRSADGELIAHQYEVPPTAETIRSNPFRDMVLDPPRRHRRIRPFYLGLGT